MLLEQINRFSDGVKQPRTEAAKIISQEIRNVAPYSNWKYKSDSNYIKSSFRSSLKFANSTDVIEVSGLRRSALSMIRWCCFKHLNLGNFPLCLPRLENMLTFLT